MRRLAGSKWTGVLTGKCERKKKILSLLAAATLCMGLMAVPFHASAADTISSPLGSGTCTGRVIYTSTYGQATSSLSGATYLYAKCGFRYGFGYQTLIRYAEQDATGTSSISAIVAPTGNPVGKGAKGAHPFSIGDGLNWRPSERTASGDVTGINL